MSSSGCVLGADRIVLNMRPNQGGDKGLADGLEQAAAVVAEVAAAARCGACVDHHTCDQLPVFMSLASGTSRVRVQRPLSEHARSACAVASQFTGAVFAVEEAEGGHGCIILSCTPPLKPARRQ